MECLQNLIGLSLCGGEPPTSGIYIDKEAGMSIELLSGIKNRETNSYAQEWQNVLNEAIRQFPSDIVNQMAKQKILFNDEVFEARKPFNGCVQLRLLSSRPDFWRGVVISIPFSKNSQIVTKRLLVWSGEEVNDVPFKIVNLNDGNQIEAGTVNLVEGVNEIPFEYVIQDNIYGINQVAILLDASYFSTRYIDLGYYSPIHGCCSNRFSWNKMLFAPANMSSNKPFIRQNVITNTYGVGIGLDFQVSCDREPFICRNIKKLTRAFVMLCMMKIADRTMLSPNQNHITQTMAQNMSAIYEIWEKEYHAEIARFIRAINPQIEGDSFCFDLNKLRNYHTYFGLP